MFGWFSKKQTQADISTEIEAITNKCVVVFTRTWRDVKPKAANPEQLANEIELFSSDAIRFMYTNYPLTKHAPPFSLWMIVFRAVQEAKTHPQQMLNDAIDILRGRYAN